MKLSYFLILIFPQLILWGEKKINQVEKYPYNSWIISSEKDNSGSKVDILWPLIAKRQYNNYKRFRFLTMISINENINDDNSDYHFYVLPFLFYGKGAGKKYAALFPLGGQIRDFMGYDYLKFLLFPFYLKTKRASEGIKISYFWPFINYYKSKTREKKIFLPFFGTSKIKNKEKSYFIIWPFIQWGKSINPKKDNFWYLFWPFYGKIKNGDEVSRSILWPFFSLKTSPKELNFHLPFPFFSYKKKFNKSNKLEYKKISIWPFFQLYQSKQGKKYNFLWPIISYEKRIEGKIIHKNSQILPILWRRSKYKNKVMIKDFYRIWPILQKESNQKFSRYRFPSIWPAFNYPAIERNIYPIFTLYDRKKFTDGSYKIKIFWGIWKREKDLKKNKNSWSLLGGLLGSEKSKNKKRIYKFFWLLF